jgi:hypothetical protein
MLLAVIFIERMKTIKKKLYDKLGDLTFPIINKPMINISIQNHQRMEFIFHNLYIKLGPVPLVAIYWIGSALSAKANQTRQRYS